MGHFLPAAPSFSRSSCFHLGCNAALACSLLLQQMDGHPSLNVDVYWIFYEEGAVLPSFSQLETGKWMLFYPPERIDERWEAAKLALRSGRMQGVVGMKVSTARAAAENAQQQQHENRGSYKSNHVMIFYCGPASDEDLMMRIGRRVARAMNPSVKSM
jgi:hypothetical protein